MASNHRRGTFAFDLSKPVRKGMLLKQGALHKAFKHRYFVLYPGFLVYYSEEERWRFDVTRGETLGSRIGAVKLRDGGACIARDAPRGCKFGILIQAPDKANKRSTYLLNASSKEERDDWIDAIRRSTPKSSPKQSPRGQRRHNQAPAATKPPSTKQAKADLELPPHPSYTTRQTTADAAALVDSEEKQEEEEVVTSIDDQLLPQQIQPRHTTADEAALLGTMRENGEAKQDEEEDEEETQRETSIDAAIKERITDEDMRQILGPTPDIADASSDEDAAGREADEAPQPMKLTETVESSVNAKGKPEVTCSVTVSLVGEEEALVQVKTEEANTGAAGESMVHPEAARGAEEKYTKEDKTLQENGDDVHSKEASFLRLENPLSVIVVTDDSTTSSSEDENEEVKIVPILKKPDKVAAASDGATSLEPAVEERERPLEAESRRGEEPSDEEGHVEFPAITLKPATIKRGSDPDIEVSEGDEEGRGKLFPQQGKRRKSSAPFTEKRGFLYKEGGKHKNWKLRFFVLQPGRFLYYKRDPSAKSLGEVKLKNVQIFYPGVGERKQSFQFTVHTESSWNRRPDWVMAAQSEKEMKEWIEAFKNAADLNMKPSSGTANGAVPHSS